MDVPSLVAGAIIGILVTLAAPPLFFLVLGLFAKTVGSDGCNVCDHYPTWQPGAHTNFRFYVHRFWHNLAWEHRRWHRQAWRDHRWNREGSDVHSDYPYEVRCSHDEHPWIPLRGPYRSIDAALTVARKHDGAAHRGESATTVVEAQPELNSVFPETSEEVELRLNAEAVKLSEDGWSTTSGRMPKGTVVLSRGKQEMSVTLDRRGRPQYNYSSRP